MFAPSRVRGLKLPCKVGLIKWHPFAPSRVRGLKPCAVLAHHYPDVVRTFTGAWIET